MANLNERVTLTISRCLISILQDLFSESLKYLGVLFYFSSLRWHPRKLFSLFFKQTNTKRDFRVSYGKGQCWAFSRI